MSQMDVAIESYNQALNASGETMKQNAVYMDSMEAKTTALKAEFEKLVLGDGGLQDFAKRLLDVGTAILKFANSDVGKLVTTLILLETTIYGVSKAWATLKIVGQTNIIASAIASLIAGEVTLGQVTSALTAKFIENAAAFAATPMGMAAIVIAAMAGVGIAIDAYNKRLEKATQKTKELAEQSEATRGELEDLKGQLKNIQDKLKEVNEEKLKITEPDQTKELERQTKELENQELVLKNQLALVEARYALEKKDEAEQAKKTLGTTQRSAYKIDQDFDPTNYGSGAMPDYAQVTAIEELNLATEALQRNTEERNRNIRLAELEARENGTNTEAWNAYQKKITEANAEIEKAQKIGQQNADTLNTTRTSLSYLGDEYADDIALIDKSTEAFLNANGAIAQTTENIYGVKDALGEENDAIEENVGELSEEESALQQLADAHNVSVDELKEWAKDLGMSEEALVAYADALGLTVEKAYEFKAQLDYWDEAIDSFQSSIGTLQSAIEEYNESQEFSIDTAQALLQLQPEYLAMLAEENGQLSLNEQAITDKCNALIEERKQTALQMAYEKLAAVERGTNQAAAESETGAVYGNADALRYESSVLSENTIQQYANRIARNDKAKGTAASQVVRELEAELKVLDKIGNSYGSISKSAKKAGSAGKSGASKAKDAQKELNKELEETKKKYDTVIKWISKQYDKKTDSIKKAKDEATDAIEKEIKALEKEKDAILDGIEKETDALEKEKDAREKYWDDQIDALKKANKEKKDALELQEKLDALEKARNTKVKIYKEGQGFVYDIDQTAVAEAQKALDEYLSEKAYEDELARLEALKDAEMDNYDKRIDALNDYKDKVSKSYEEQIDALNEHKEALEEQYDAEIELYENYKQQFEDMVNAYEEEQNRLLAQQLTGIDFEKDNWMTRLDNLAEFVRKYNELQKQLDTGNTSVSNDASMKSGGTSGGGSSGKSSASTKAVNASSSKTSQGQGVIGSRDASQSTFNAKTLEAARKRAGITTHASGASSIKDDELAIVGENPNQEIVIGSKLNNGELMSLNKGSGVVNAESSNTLAGMLNQVGKFGSSGFGSGNGTLNSNINNDTLTINGVTIQGADIKDPQTFVNGLLNLKAEALQRAYSHR